jgi:hypothetical protein
MPCLKLSTLKFVPDRIDADFTVRKFAGCDFSCAKAVGQAYRQLNRIHISRENKKHTEAKQLIGSGALPPPSERAAR